jgi:hypothetical protein
MSIVTFDSISVIRWRLVSFINAVNKGNNKLRNSEQSYKGKVQTHNYINRQLVNPGDVLAGMLYRSLTGKRQRHSERIICRRPLQWMWLLNVWDNVPVEFKYICQQYFTCMCFLEYDFCPVWSRVLICTHCIRNYYQHRYCACVNWYHYHTRWKYDRLYNEKNIK